MRLFIANASAISMQGKIVVAKTAHEGLDSLSTHSVGTHASMSCLYSPDMTCGESLAIECSPSSRQCTPAGVLYNDEPRQSTPLVDRDVIASLIR